jgi:hypothetical protein
MCSTLVAGVQWLGLHALQMVEYIPYRNHLGSTGICIQAEPWYGSIALVHSLQKMLCVCI